MNPVRGALVKEGKTQRVWGVEGDDSLIIQESKSDITAYDNPSLTKQFEGKAEYATATTCRVFELLKQAGTSLAYRQQLSPTEFLAEKCEAIPLEVCVRRYAPWYSSYTKRHPELAASQNAPFHRFHRLQVEFFLKTTNGELKSKDGNVLIQGLRREYGEEDPLIEFTGDAQWKLLHSKCPRWSDGADLHRIVPALVSPYDRGEIEKIVRRAFLVAEGAWNILGHHLIDGKFEFGLTKDGRFVIIDVFDNDSWRLCNPEFQEMSKETFRQKKPLDEVKRHYAAVAALAEQFRVPRQLLVFWCSSRHDALPIVPYSAVKEKRIILNCREVRKCLNQLEKLERDYPEGGVIIVKAREGEYIRSLLISQTTWPVVVVPANVSRDCEEEAVDFAANILASKNPVLYMERRFRVEELDA